MSYEHGVLGFKAKCPELPDASLLAKFRTQRLKDTSVDDIITEVVRQCVEYY